MAQVTRLIGGATGDLDPVLRVWWGSLHIEPPGDGGVG